MKISNDDLLDIGTGKQMLADFIPKILCHSTRNEFAVGENHAIKASSTKSYTIFSNNIVHSVSFISNVYKQQYFQPVEIFGEK